MTAAKRATSTERTARGARGTGLPGGPGRPRPVDYYLPALVRDSASRDGGRQPR